MVLLKTSEKSGTCFIRTDQLDGETDWKLRVAVSITQNLEKNSDLLDIGAQIYAEKPQLRIHAFEGIFIKVGWLQLIYNSVVLIWFISSFVWQIYLF